MYVFLSLNSYNSCISPVPPVCRGGDPPTGLNTKEEPIIAKRFFPSFIENVYFPVTLLSQNVSAEDIAYTILYTPALSADGINFHLQPIAVRIRNEEMDRSGAVTLFLHHAYEILFHEPGIDIKMPNRFNDWKESQKGVWRFNQYYIVIEYKVVWIF